MPLDLPALFDKGFTYAEFLDKYATDDQKTRWNDRHAAVVLTEAQQSLLQGFVREMKVLVVAGAWCGDCIEQCPILQRFAGANERIQLRFYDRDEEPEFASEMSVCGAKRVPAVLFVSEDDFPCGRYGDRTLSKYRRMAANTTGAACPTGLTLPGDDLLGAVVGEWLDEFERIQWMLRTSHRLRTRHGD